MFANNIGRLSIATSVYIRTTCLRLPRYYGAEGSGDGCWRTGKGRKLAYLSESGRRRTEAWQQDRGKEMVEGRFRGKREGERGGDRLVVRGKSLGTRGKWERRVQIGDS